MDEPLYKCRGERVKLKKNSPTKRYEVVSKLCYVCHFDFSVVFRPQLILNQFYRYKYQEILLLFIFFQKNGMTFLSKCPQRDSLRK